MRLLLLASLLPAALTVGLFPVTFLMYNFATATEQLTDAEALRGVLAESRADLFASQLKTLVKVCQLIDFAVETHASSAARSQSGSHKEYWPFERIIDAGNPDALVNLLAMFQFADNDGSADLSRSDLLQLSTSLGYELDSGEMDAFLGLFDLNRDGSVEFSEFATVIMYGGFRGSTTLEGLFDRILGFFDPDQDGVIENREMLAKLAIFGFDERGVDQLFVTVCACVCACVCISPSLMFDERGVDQLFVAV